MTSWNDDTKHSVIFTNDVRKDIFGGPGQATGLLISPPYPAATVLVTWNDDTKHATTFNNDTKH